jgi:hypothetical protein
MSYSNGEVTLNYQLKAATISSAARLQTLIGPAGKSGRLNSITSTVTTGVTDAASTITVGTAGDPDSAGTLTVAVSSAAAVQNNVVLVTPYSAVLAADTAFVIDVGGECTAGAADINVAITWY